MEKTLSPFMVVVALGRGKSARTMVLTRFHETPEAARTSARAMVARDFPAKARLVSVGPMASVVRIVCSNLTLLPGAL